MARFMAVALAALIPVAVYAFDGEEHRLVSRSALQLALKVCGTIADCVTSSADPQTVPFLDLEGPVEYGLLVSATDYRVNPLQILQSFGSYSQLPRSLDDLDPALIKTLTSHGVPFLRAAASNDTHFQGELIAGIRHWHEYAVSIAAGSSGQEPNLFSALVVNAISDHFLEDFFAPGHLITPRFGSHDAVALGTHNYYNAFGLLFGRDCDCFRTELRPLLDAMRHGADPKTTIALNAFDSSRGTPLWGDGDLWRSPSQKVLMTVLVARSILDILESHATRKPVNHFRDLFWKPYRTLRNQSRLLVQLPRVGMSYGDILYPLRAPKILFHGDIVSVTAGAEVFAGSDSSSRAVKRLDYLLWSTSPYKFVRDNTKPETPAAFRARQLLLGISWANARNDSESARGIGLRGVLAVPLIHSQFAVDVMRKKYTSGELSARRISYGAAFQTGFSILQAELGAGHDYTYRDGELRPALALRFGANVTLPLSAVPGIGKLDTAYARFMRWLVHPSLEDVPPCDPPKKS